MAIPVDASHNQARTSSQPDSTIESVIVDVRVSIEVVGLGDIVDIVDWQSKLRDRISLRFELAGGWVFD